MSLGRTAITVAAAGVLGVGAFAFARNTRAFAEDRAADVSVSCAPSQRAVVRQTMAGASPQVQVVCAESAAAVPTGFAVSEDGQVVRAAYTSAGIASPAVYYPQAVGSVRSQVAPAPRAVRATAQRTTTARQVTRASSTSSWQRRALVIGGSAGAGAGIGALIGGKKGALIGAAIGGGGATVVDQVKQR